MRHPPSLLDRRDRLGIGDLKAHVKGDPLLVDRLFQIDVDRSRKVESQRREQLLCLLFDICIDADICRNFCHTCSPFLFFQRYSNILYAFCQHIMCILCGDFFEKSLQTDRSSYSVGLLGCFPFGYAQGQHERTATRRAHAPSRGGDRGWATPLILRAKPEESR